MRTPHHEVHLTMPTFLDDYNANVAERAAKGIPPLPLTPEQTAELCELLLKNPGDEADVLLELLTHRVAPGVDQSSYVKATFLYALILETSVCPVISVGKAFELLGTMLGGYNVDIFMSCIRDAGSGNANSKRNARLAAEQLATITLVYNAFDEIVSLANAGNDYAKDVLQAWARADWFTQKPELPQSITVTVFKVEGETNTDDLSPATHATTRPDIPLHAESMLETRKPGALEELADCKASGRSVAYVGDVVGTGSSRKSAINSVLWHIGNDIPFVPNKRNGGVIIGGKIAPIFFDTAQDSGALPIECDVSQMETGNKITIYPYRGEIHKEGKVIATFNLRPSTMPDAIRAGGRIPLIIGRTLTAKARAALNMEPSSVFIQPEVPNLEGQGFTLAQKIVGRACGIEGVLPGMYCEPVITTVGSQDTTGPMTRDELKELACLGFSAGLVLQTFCHTAAYPKPVDLKTHAELPDVFTSRGGVALRPGDGIIHSWLNRMLLPDTVGTGGDSHTRFPLGISFPAGSGLVAFAAAVGAMPLDMPESVLVRFTGKLQPGITIRDIVNAIPYVAIQQGKLTVPKKNKKNVFAGRIIEMEGLPDLKVEQAFELTDATAERNAAGCTIKLSENSVADYLRSNIALLRSMIAKGYTDAATLERRIKKMEEWLANPSLLSADADAQYADIIEINLDEIKEPILAAPNDPDNVKLLSECAGDSVQEVFIGSCMTNIGHYRAGAAVIQEGLRQEGTLAAKLWFVPPTGLDEKQLRSEGVYDALSRAIRNGGQTVHDYATARGLSPQDARNAAEAANAVLDMPGCSLCMGNQARAQEGVTVFSTSTRNFDNRLGNGAQVYLGSAELAAVCVMMGKIPTREEYMAHVEPVSNRSDEFFRYLQLDQGEFAPALTALT